VGNKFTRALKSWGTPSLEDRDSSPSASDSHPSSPVSAKKRPTSGGDTTPSAADAKAKTPAIDEALLRAKSEVRDSIRTLLNLIETRDNLLIASRRAYYSLDVSNKGMLYAICYMLYAICYIYAI
jgi:hypothetical protein